MFRLLAVVLFALFFGNVLMGSLGGNPLLGDRAEMLLLVAVSVCFVAAILRAEAKRAKDIDNDTKP